MQHYFHQPYQRGQKQSNNHSYPVGQNYHKNKSQSMHPTPLQQLKATNPEQDPTYNPPCMENPVPYLSQMLQ